MVNELASPTVHFSAGGYSYISGVSQYSAGVAALAGYSIQHLRFTKPVPLAEGFERIAKVLAAAGRPLTAFCACELRASEPFTEETFKTFNQAYVGVLKAWGLIENGVNPVTRSCVCPEIDPPAEPAFYAFSYTVQQEGPASFVIAGSGEVPEGKSNYREHIIRRGDLTPDALREKAYWVVDEMERRMAAFGADWSHTTAVQVYTVHDLHKLVTGVLVPRDASPSGLTWHFARPPVVDIEYEMDCRRVHLDGLHEV